jgi:hypothetical protein
MQYDRIRRINNPPAKDMPDKVAHDPREAMLSVLPGIKPAA